MGRDNRLLLLFLTLAVRIQPALTETIGDATVVGIGTNGNVTDDKQAVIFGMRAEMPPDEITPFGYDIQTGIAVMPPDTPAKIVVYGIHLDKLTELIFTLTDNCSDPIRVINHENDFSHHFEHRVVFDISLPIMPDPKKPFKMCYKQQNPMYNVDLKPLAESRLMLSTEHPPRQHYLPVPIQISVIAFLLCLSALFSGLTLGLMSLTVMELELVKKCGSPAEQRYAADILPVRRSGNQLLCSLLLGNVIVNSAISILFGDLTAGYFALIISSAGIVIFGEILPQSFCVKKGLAVGARTIFITRFFIFLTFPLAWPISKLLDWLLGEEYVGYDRKRLMEMMKMATRGETGQLADELKIAVGAMEIADKVVADVMTRIDDVFMLPDTTVLNAKMVAEILRMGYTRIPVFRFGDKNDVRDILFIKDLALLDPDDCFTVKTVCGYHQHPVKFVFADTPLRVMLEEFKKGECHLAMVKQVTESGEHDPNFDLVGVVTLEDIVEEILQAEIVDETDTITDNVKRTRRKNAPIRDLSKLYDKEAPDACISLQMQMVAVHWLVANERAFRTDLISRDVLERLIRVDISGLRASDTVAVPRIAKLFTKGEPSERYILILEGRALVTIGQGGMKFEAGPWHAFGSELLNDLVSKATYIARSKSILDGNELSPARRADLMFTPDYTVIIPEDCTYLEVTACTYVNAYRATLMQREIRAMSNHHDSHSETNSSRPPSPPTSNNANDIAGLEDEANEDSKLLQNETTQTRLGADELLLQSTLRRQSLDHARAAVEALNQYEHGVVSKEETLKLLEK